MHGDYHHAIGRAMARITTLKPRVSLSGFNRARVLEQSAGSTKRIRGEEWMRIKGSILIRDKYTCKVCGTVHMSNQVDHVVPLEKGGSNDPANLQTLCIECHKAKTKVEAKARYTGGYR